MGAGFQAYYFDWVYNPVYDLTVGQLAPYRRFQDASLDLLSLQRGDTVLSVGVGTGNEIVRLWKRGRDQGVRLVAVDLSRRGLARVHRKVRWNGGAMELFQMDARRLALADGKFERVLCLHTMDFLNDASGATRELLRVLKKGGEFVVTYPSGKGSVGLAKEVGASVLQDLRHGRLLRALREGMAGGGAGIVYLPLAFFGGPKHGDALTRASLERLLESLGVSPYTIQEDRIYQDYIVWGRR